MSIATQKAVQAVARSHAMPLNAACNEGADPAALIRAWLASPAGWETLQRLSRQLGLTEDEGRALPAALAAELARRLPDILAAAALAAALPLLTERLLRRFRRVPGLSGPDAEDLSQAAAVKALGALYGSPPRGNAGAWVASVAGNVLKDHLRRAGLARRKLGRRFGTESLAAAPARHTPAGV